MLLNLTVDENIPFARDAFGTLGHVHLLPGRAITREQLATTEVLIVRSVTKVNADLLHLTPVEFVGTATIGTDHIDLDYLQEKEITFASAAGGNANSVAEYVVAALLQLAVARSLQLEGMTIGIVGVGNVGSRVAAKARALGMRVLLNDPPLAGLLINKRLAGTKAWSHETSKASDDFSELPAIRGGADAIVQSPDDLLPLEALMDADFVTLHTPLTRSGPHATFHLFDEAHLRQLKRECILLNTARGAVVDNRALGKVMRQDLLAGAVLDVWENEPQIDTKLLQMTTIASPHIAGYSLDGKVQGTLQIYRAVCRFLDTQPRWDPAPHLPAIASPVIGVEINDRTAEEILQRVVNRVYDIAADDRSVREMLKHPEWTRERRGDHFDQLRRNYPVRREFYNYAVALPEHAERLLRKLRGLGFRVAEPHCAPESGPAADT